MTAAGLALDQVTLRLGGRVVLDDLSLDVRPGELLALVGPNGSGKTTALRMLTGALMPDVGRALIDGRSVAGLGRRAVAGRIAHLPQGFRSHWNLTVRDLVRLGAARGAGWWQAGRPAAPDPALDLGDLLDRRLDDLSGGGGLGAGRAGRCPACRRAGGGAGYRPRAVADAAVRKLAWIDDGGCGVA